MRDFWKAALIRALRTVCQTLASSLPVGTVVTVTMIKEMDVSIVYCILAWLATALLNGVASLLTSIATGLPEVDMYFKAQEDLAKDNEGCYEQMVMDCNQLREELYPGEEEE